MRERKSNFRHDSLQDSQSIQGILKSISNGLAKGKISFSDEDDTIVMRPEGLAGPESNRQPGAT